MTGEHENSDIAGIVVTHGKLADELIRTVELIIGPQRDLHAVSASDLCDEDIIGQIRRIIGRGDRKKVLVFVDYFGGSCCTNSVRAVKGEQGITVMSGVNLPVLLAFATKRGTLPFEELVDQLIRRGRESVRVIDL